MPTSRNGIWNARSHDVIPIGMKQDLGRAHSPELGNDHARANNFEKVVVE